MQRKYRIRLSTPDFFDISKQEGLAYLWPKIENINLFEAALAEEVGIAYALALNSGTSALHLSLMLSGVAEGDEVICPDFTFAATVNAVLYQKAIPVFVDSEHQTWNLSPAILEYAIEDRIRKGKKPKAVIVVHSYGMPAAIEEIAFICKKYGITLIEDAAGALGSKFGNKMLGAWGDLGIYSFNINKIINTGGGGAIVTHNEEMYVRGKYLANQAKSGTPYYEHLELGYNYTINIFGAGFGVYQLKTLKEKVRSRRDIFNYYRDQLGEISFLTFVEESELSFCNRWLSTVLIDGQFDLEALKAKFDESDIEVRYVWKPMHSQPVFQKYPRYLNGTSTELFKNGLCLPSGNKLSLENQDEIISILFDFFNL